MDGKRISGDDTDRLSNLPCSVIGHILAFLPLTAAARTCVLSKKWKDKWLTIPRLVFDSDIYEPIIYRVLLLHKAPIVKFAILGAHIWSYNALNHWLNFLSDHRIEVLTIIPDFGDDYDYNYVMPYCLFSFHHLKHLRIYQYWVRVPSTYNGFCNLLSIDLEGAYIELEDLQRLISKCPMLEVLSIDRYYRGSGTLNISTPTNFMSFFFRGVVDFIYIDSNPLLEEVTIIYDLLPKAESESEIGTGTLTALNYAVPFFSQLTMINRLMMNGYFLQVLARSVPSKLTNSLNGLINMHIYDIDLRRGDNVSPVLCLLRSSPNLQTLVLGLKKDTSDTQHYEGDDKIQYLEAIKYLLEAQISTVPLFSSVKEVKFFFFAGLEPEMEFLKLLLMWAKELEKVEIRMIKSKENLCLGVLEKLEGYPRASSQEVISLSQILDRPKENPNSKN